MDAEIESGYQEASDMLAEALKQMDGIIADTLKRDKSKPKKPLPAEPSSHHNGAVTPGSPDSPPSSPHSLEHTRAVRLLNDLRVTLEGTHNTDQGRIFRQLAPDTQNFLQDWLERSGQENHNRQLTNGYSGHHSYDNSDSKHAQSECKLRQLETDKDDLHLQVTVLSEQIEAQVEKIRDLETELHVAHSNGNHGYDGGNGKTTTHNGYYNHMELLNRSHGNGNGPDTHKLDLLAENSGLKLRLAAVDREKTDLEHKLNYAQKRMDDLQSRLNDQTMEISDLRSRYAKNGTIPSSPEPSDSEVDRLKSAVESLMITNSEKDIHIDDLKQQVRRYHRLEAALVGGGGRQDPGAVFDDSDSSSTHHSHTSSGDTATRDNGERPFVRPDLRGALVGHPTATSTPVNMAYESPTSPGHLSNGHHGNQSPGAANTPLGRSSSYEDVKPHLGLSPSKQGPGYGGTLPKDARFLDVSDITMATTPARTYPPPPYSLEPDPQPRPRASTLPKGKPPKAPGQGTLTPKGSFKGHRSSNSRLVSPAANLTAASIPEGSASNENPPIPSVAAPRRHQKGFKSFGKGIFKGSRSKKWSTSAPDLAQTETDEEALKDEMAQQYKHLQQRNTDQLHRKHKSKGIKRFFGKLRRSNSQDLDQDKVGDFKRSGLRATAGPRLGWSKDMKYSDLDVPFPRWDTDRISSWLHAMGLSMYVGDCKRWAKNGDQLLKATGQELEKELGIRNHFHRKKLQMALSAVVSSERSPMDDLDHTWVTRWLDDIGLPQYKDAFSGARIDGRMLHYLTVEDLVSLKVTNVLHHLSVKRAIQVLRLSDFNQACLTRRPLPDETNPQNAPGDVMLWTNHRVMEWLRSIDLSEYAPNLRGSGVHGGLMVLEPRFGAEILASLLSIPGSKTLLRRHLSTHYVALIGNDIQGKKRELETQPGFIPLTPNQKVKLKKKLFSHKRSRSIDATDEDLVCPQGVTSMPVTNGNSSPVTPNVSGSRVSNGGTQHTSPASRSNSDEKQEATGCLG